MAGRVVAVKVEVLAIVAGLWCDRCMLSTGQRATVAVTQGGRMHLQDRYWCPEHGGSRGIHAPENEA